MTTTTDLPKNRQGRAAEPGRIKTWVADLADPVLRETTWEAEMQAAGVSAYEDRRTASQERGNGFSEDATGKKFLRKLLKPVLPAISTMQGELLKTSTPKTLKGTLYLVPADTMALLTLNVLVNMTYAAQSSEIGAAYQVMVREVAKAVETQAQFQSWIKSSRKLAEEWAKAKGLEKVPTSFADQMIAGGEIKSKSLKHQWKKAFEEIEGSPWTTEQKHFCGDALLTTVINALPSHFESHSPFVKGRQMKHVRMTDPARAEIEKIDAALMAHQVVKKPMLIPPQAWKRT